MASPLPITRCPPRAGLQLPGAQDTWATLLTRLADLNGVKPGMYFRDELRLLQPPMLIVWGEHDMAPPEVSRSTAALIPHCQFVVLPGVGCFPVQPASCHTSAKSGFKFISNRQP